MKKQLDITDLHFYYKQFDSNTGKIERYDVFDSFRVLRSVAQWVVMSEERRKTMRLDALHYCFFDLCSRCEYEFVMQPWTGNGEPTKVDIWGMYIEPNAEILLDMVSRVTKVSARRWLRDNR